VGKTVEKAANVHIEHPVHFLRQQSGVERIQRITLALPRPESVRETQKVGFVGLRIDASCGSTRNG
jgi:hypothetical protein